MGCFSCVNFHFYGLCSVQGSHAGLDPQHGLGINKDIYPLFKINLRNKVEGRGGAYL